MTLAAADDDLQLLRRYARTRDEAAFAAVVRRHLDLVYSAAARRVGDRHLAEDVTQAVFVILATKANSVPAGRPISQWLLTAVRYAAANALKIEARRRRHEHAAASSRRADAASVGSCSSNPSDVLIWQEVASRLDDAVLNLPANDRRAVLLRFFEDRPIRDIAAELNVSEDAAKQRVSRAVERLRQRLDRMGAGGVASLGAAGLGTLLAAQTVRAAPAGLSNAAALAGAATGIGAGGGGTAAGVTIAKGAIQMMTLAKTKLAAAAIAAVVAIAGVGGAITMNLAVAQDNEAVALAQRPAAARDDAAGAAKAADPNADDAPADNAGPRGGGLNVRTAPPVVVSTEPKAGATDVDAGVTEIKVTFSKHMQNGNWSFAQLSKQTFPQTTGKPRYLDDKRTCVLPVKLEPGRTYVIALNKPPFDSFTDTGRRKAMEYLLVFETKK